VTLIETPRFNVTADGVSIDGHGIQILEVDGNRLLSGDVHAAGDAPNYNRLELTAAAFALGFDVDPLFDADHMTVYAAGDRFSVDLIYDEESGLAPRFVGFISSDAFSAVELFVDFEAYFVDNVTLPVPEPSTGILFALGLGLLRTTRSALPHPTLRTGR
jgi:hypothetical protein